MTSTPVRRALPVIAATAGGFVLLANFEGAPPTTTLPSGSRRTVDGPAVDTPWGPVQVRVTLAGEKIVDVEPLQLPRAPRQAKQLSDAAAPALRQEVLSAQSVRVHNVTGATYTTEAYLKSLQNALG